MQQNGTSNGVRLFSPDQAREMLGLRRDVTELLYGSVETLRKAIGVQDPGGRSAQTDDKGLKPHPFRRSKTKLLMAEIESHGRCIRAKVNATVGVGHVTPEERQARERIVNGDPTGVAILQSKISTNARSKADDVLDPLTTTSWKKLIREVCEDYWQVGDGYIEVVRSTVDDEIKGLHYVPAEEIRIVTEGEGKFHFEMSGPSGTKPFACFGDGRDFAARHNKTLPDEGKYSEIINIQQPSSLSVHYGFPDWFGATASIDLMKALRQWKFDFFRNRGVPEFILTVTGQEIDPEKWAQIETLLRSHVGLGNSHKSMALNFDGPDVEVEVHKLAMEQDQGDGLESTDEALAIKIVNAHGVPPLLAGILIPGKLGATNELPNALVAFQTLVIGPEQLIFQSTLGVTLGDPEKNGGLGLTMEDFEFRKIVDAYDFGSLNTMSRMRQTVPEANAEGRDLSRGVRD